MKILLLTLLLTGCALHLVAQYDPVLDTGISAFQTKCDSFFKGRADSSVQYSSTFYDGVSADLQALVTRARGIPLDSLTVKILGNLQSEVNSVDSIDKRASLNGHNPSPAFFQLSAETIDQGCEEALKFELAKKRGAE